MERASLLVALGRPGEARTLLTATGISTPSSQDDAQWHHLVLAAAEACLGDDGAYEWFVDVASTTYRSGAAPVAWLVGTVADHRADLSTADAAWIDEFAENGAVTPERMSRFCVALVHGRDRDSSEDVLERVVLAARVLLNLDETTGYAGETVDLVAHDLLERGDRAGLLLLLRVLHQLDPWSPAIRDRLKAEGKSVRRRVALLLGGVLAMFCAALGASTAGVEFAPSLFVAVPIAVVAFVGIRLPELTLPETRFWHAARGITTRLIDGSQPHDRGRAYAGAVLLGVFFGLLFALTLTASVDEQDGFWGSGLALWMRGPGVPAVWFVSLTAWIGGLVLATQWLNRWIRRRERLKNIATRQRAALRSSSTCDCQHVEYSLGFTAAARVENHLEPAAESLAQLEVSEVLGSNASILVCQETSALWLWGRLGGSGRSVLLNGGRPSTGTTDEPSLGMYL